jgi:hypothetical protein
MFWLMSEKFFKTLIVSLDICIIYSHLLII